MAFKYKLETILKIRQRIEEQVQYKLAHEIFVLENHKIFLGELRDSRLELIMTIEEKKKKIVEASLYSFYSESLLSLDRQIGFQLNAVEAQEQIVDQVRSELEEKSQQRRIVERMKEKEYLDYAREMARKEHKELDELSVLRFGQGQM